MKKYSQFKKIYSQIQVIRHPKHRLATFGSTHIDYCLITDVKGFADRARLRHGRVMSEKPSLLTPETFKNRFHGFGEEAREYAEWVVSQYGNTLRSLEYQFRNEHASSRIELMAPDKLAQKLAKEFDRKSEFRSALLRGTDKLWELSVMKFIIEETLASFSTNLQELEERGFFDGEDRQAQRRHREVQYWLKKAKQDSQFVPKVGKLLKDYGLFEQYQDDFFKLVHS